jgi:RND family efflux transporter MFP subunit
MSSPRMVCLVALLSAACVRSRDPEPTQPPLVRTFTVAPRNESPLELRGQVSARSRLRLGFKLAGVVEEVLVRKADRVARGQLVARLDDLDARSIARAARAARDKAKRDADRAERLAQEGALASSVRDDAKSQLETAEAHLAQAEDALGRTRLTAPVAGTVVMRMAEPGETLDAGSPVIILDTTGVVEVTAGATERELKALRLGQSVELLPEEGGRAFAGRVSALASTPNPADGLYTVEASPEVGAFGLRPGALLRMRFAAGTEAQSLRIPLEALVHRLGRDYVFVVEPGAAGAVARLRPIEAGAAEGRDVGVLSGLSGGERVVAEGAYFLQDGQAVRVLESR